MERVSVQVVTKLKRNMKQSLMPFGDRLLLQKRAVVETVIDDISTILNNSVKTNFSYFSNPHPYQQSLRSYRTLTFTNATEVILVPLSNFIAFECPP